MKNTLRYLLFILLACGPLRICAQDLRSSPVQLPVKMDLNRFLLKIPTNSGDTILGYCDTGGGYTAIYPSTLSKLGMQASVQQVVIDGDTTRFIPASRIYADNMIPYPEIQRYFKGKIAQPFFEVPADDPQNDVVRKLAPHDAFLGQFFFIGHAWTFNYLKGQLFINTTIDPNITSPNTQPVGFRKDRSGLKIFGHPSMKIMVDGKEVDVLFDTGAMFLLSDSGRSGTGINARSMGGSFIARSAFEQWRKDHPDWKVITKGEITGADMIEVPEVKVGNLRAGPVWFARRPDEAWSKGMVGSMDRIVKGAIGGSLLQYFKVTIDYNSERIQFEQ